MYARRSGYKIYLEADTLDNTDTYVIGIIPQPPTWVLPELKEGEIKEVELKIKEEQQCKV